MALTTDFKIPKLNGANYRDWTFNMRLHLETLDLFGHFDDSIEVPVEEASAQVKQDFKLAAKKAWTYTLFGIDWEEEFKTVSNFYIKDLPNPLALDAELLQWKTYWVTFTGPP